MHRHSRIFIVGHNDSVDNSLSGYFSGNGFAHVYSNVHNRIDLLNQAKTLAFFKKVKPEYVFLGSIRSGGIVANQKSPAEFI